MSKRIVMLCSECFSTNALYNYINEFHPIQTVIVEQSLRGSTLAKRRLKKLGVVRVTGQILFSIVVVNILKVISRRRVEEIKRGYRMNERPIPDVKKIKIKSVNDEKCISVLKELRPEIVLVNGTRIISKRVLESIDASFINMHTGITPMYRGVHGGYWAIANKDPEHCGVTVHFVDNGIDTGRVLYQSKIKITDSDNYFTYPFLQFGEGIPLVKKALDDLLRDNLNPIQPLGAFSKLWYHPTIWQYLFFRIFHKAK